MRLALLLALATSACAQPATDPAPRAKPDADAPNSARDSASQRADSVIERPSAGAPGPSVDTLAVAAGETAVRLVVHAFPGETAVNMLNVHDDEGTSVEAALDVARERGGRVVEIVHTGERNLTFAVGGRRYTADPNRMFTDAGRRRTLRPQPDPAALDALRAFADTVLAVYARAPTAVVVTLHNNTPDGYSARSYEPGAEYAGDAAAVVVRTGSDPDDFFFVTDRALYDALVGRGFNAVLQDNAAATDDGSLSVWAAREGVPYVNVEAERGHRAEQVRMVRALVGVLAGDRQPGGRSGSGRR